MRVYEQVTKAGEGWCIQHPELLFVAFQDGYTFIAVHPSYGIVVTAADIEEFEAKLNDRRPSVLNQLYLTCTSLWVHLVHE